MKEIVKNKYYEFAYDESTNWIYYTMKGFWENMGVVPNYQSDWDKAINIAKKPFKIFGDLSKLKVMPEDVKKENEKAQQKSMQKGCIKVACLMDSVITKRSLNEVNKKSGLEKIIQYFTSEEINEAKKWLSM